MILLWYCRKRIKSCGYRRFCRTFQKTHHFLEKCIKTCHNNQQIKTTSVKANLQIKNFRGKNDDEMKNFHENLKKKLTHFLRHLWLIKAKMKMKMKKYGKISSVLEFCISILGYIGIYLTHFIGHFWLIETKMKMKMKKYGKMSPIF